MRKVIATMNMTLDGFCDHTAGIANDETHQHYSDLLSSGDTILYGRITYQMMEGHWPNLVKNPSGNKQSDEFALLLDNISKIVFSHTLKDVDWKNSELKHDIVKEDILGLKQQAGKNILVGSPSLIVALTQLDLIDEYQLMIHPIVLGHGLTLFKDVRDLNLKLLKTNPLSSGPVVLYYEPANRSA